MASWKSSATGNPPHCGGADGAHVLDPAVSGFGMMVSGSPAAPCRRRGPATLEPATSAGQDPDPSADTVTLAHDRQSSY